MAILLTASLLLASFSPAYADPKLSDLKLPAGFQIETIAKIPNARGMTFSPSGTLFVGSRTEGRVYAVKFDRDWKNPKIYPVALNFEQPVGVAFKDGDLYFSSISKIYKIKDVEKDLMNSPKPVLVTDQLPDKAHHGWKFIAFGPDGMLYVPIGAPCNVCDEKGFSNIMRMKPDGTGLEVYASGIRNTVGFDWHPTTKELWFTENGRDWMGDDIPPCELNHAPKAGMHFGFPYCHGSKILDPVYGKDKKCADYTTPAFELQAHVAPLGMRFYRGKMFPEKFRNQFFVAEHGSWNRSKKSGYRLMLATTKAGKITSYEPFVDGFMKNEKAWGRPVDVENAPDGSLIVSDDEANAIYRITYSSPK